MICFGHEMGVDVITGDMEWKLWESVIVPLLIFISLPQEPFLLKRLFLFLLTCSITQMFGVKH